MKARTWLVPPLLTLMLARVSPWTARLFSPQRNSQFSSRAKYAQTSRSYILSRDDDQQDDELLEADGPERPEFWTIYECDEGFDDGQQIDEPVETDQPRASTALSLPIWIPYTRVQWWQKRCRVAWDREPLNLEDSFLSDMNPPDSRVTTMMNRMMSRLRQTALKLDDSVWHINSHSWLNDPQKTGFGIWRWGIGGVYGIYNSRKIWS